MRTPGSVVSVGEVHNSASDAVSLYTAPGPFADPEALPLGEADGQSGFKVLAEYFGGFASLSNAELELLRELTTTSHYHPPHRNLWVAGAPPPPPRMLIAGWACRYRSLSNGRRQIVNFILPGDFIGPVLQPRLPSLCSVAAITEIETVSAKPLADVAAAAHSDYPNLAFATHLTAHLQDTLLCEQVARLGQQNASERFANLMLELCDRLGRRGLTHGNQFSMPLTQDVLADALGLSVVHLNRTVQQLRRDGLLKLRGGIITLLQLDRLQALASWSPSRLPAR